MNNFIKYFYNIQADKLVYNNDHYIFKANNKPYKLYIYNGFIDINNILSINRIMLDKTLVDEIIINKFNSPISKYNNINYILIKINYNITNKITLNEINYIDTSLATNNLSTDWGLLWSKKIDYLENLINENGKKYPLLVDSFNYFVGLTENAISYYNNIIIPKNYTYYISHRIIRINDTTEILYNPLNIIYDYQVRDIAEYIKNSFFTNNKVIFNELDNYLHNHFLSLIDIKLLISRILYPSFYFEMYDDILINNMDEKIILDIIKKTNDYEIYLNNVITYFRKHYDIEEISWIKKRVNLH